MPHSSELAIKKENKIRVTVMIEPGLIRALKVKAYEQGVSYGHLIRQAIRSQLKPGI